MEQKPKPNGPARTHQEAAAAFAEAASPDYARRADIPPRDRFATLLAALGLNDTEAAQLLGIARPLVHHIRSGTRSPSFDSACRVEAVLGIPATHWNPLPDDFFPRPINVGERLKELRKALKARKAAQA